MLTLETNTVFFISEYYDQFTRYAYTKAEIIIPVFGQLTDGQFNLDQLCVIVELELTAQSTANE